MLARRPLPKTSHRRAAYAVSLLRQCITPFTREKKLWWCDKAEQLCRAGCRGCSSKQRGLWVGARFDWLVAGLLTCLDWRLHTLLTTQDYVIDVDGSLSVLMEVY
jgi:hypothetical protein